MHQRHHRSYRAFARSGTRTALTLAALVIGCGRAYTPRTRQFTVTTVPLLVKELAPTYPFLAKDFAKGGVLDGKEVYAFEPSTLTVYAGDTLVRPARLCRELARPIRHPRDLRREGTWAVPVSVRDRIAPAIDGWRARRALRPVIPHRGQGFARLSRLVASRTLQSTLDPTY
jgi:hypothetical protein